MTPASVPDSCVAFATMVSSTVCRSSVELTAWVTSRQRLQLLHRARELIGALAQLIEQPRVLDGDDGLRGEVRDQLDLLVGERPHLLAVDGDRADQAHSP